MDFDGKLWLPPKPAIIKSIGEVDPRLGILPGLGGAVVGSRKGASQTLKVIFLKSGTSWTVPSDWNSNIFGPQGFANIIECLAGGASGRAQSASGYGDGGGGGGLSKISNFSAIPGQSIQYAVGVGGATSSTSGYLGQAGGNTWFNGTSLASASCSAEGGKIASGGGNGGAAANGIGEVKYSGGKGGDSTSTGAFGNGGGAAGRTGNGGNASTGTAGLGAPGPGGGWVSNPGGEEAYPGRTSSRSADIEYGFGGRGGYISNKVTNAPAAGKQGIIVISYYPTFT